MGDVALAKEAADLIAALRVSPLRKHAVGPTPNATITFDGQTAVLLQAGHYLLRSPLTDNVGNKSIRHELDIEVTAP